MSQTIHLRADADYGHTGQFIARITGRNARYTFEREFLGRKSGKRNDITEADVDDPGLYECCNISRKSGKDSRFTLVVQVGDDLLEFDSNKEDAMKIGKAMDQGREFGDIVVGHKADPEAVDVENRRKALKKLVVVEGTPGWQGRLNGEVILACPVGGLHAGDTVKLADIQPEATAALAEAEARLATLRESDKYPGNVYKILDKKESARKTTAQTIDSATDACWAVLQALPTRDANKVLKAIKDRLKPPASPKATAESELVEAVS